MIKRAIISDCGTYRYNLIRAWDHSLPPVCFIMLNPSTADADNDDNTIRKCVKYAKAWGYGSLYVVNLFAYRATDPKDILAITNLHILKGNCNLSYISSACHICELVICAWSNHGRHLDMASKVLKTILSNHKEKLHYLRMNKTGHPAHPLYLPDNLTPLRAAGILC